MRIALLAVLALAGCATVPASHVESAYSQPGPGLHVVTVERVQWPPGKRPLTVWVDGKPAANLPSGQAINLYLPEGRHILGVGMDTLTGTQAPQRTLAIDVSATSRPILRASTVAIGYGGWELERVD